MGGPNQENCSKFGSCIEISNPKTCKGPTPTEKGAQKGAHFGFLVTQGALCQPHALKIKKKDVISKKTKFTVPIQTLPHHLSWKEVLINRTPM